jgi:hypothetical protein
MKPRAVRKTMGVSQAEGTAALAIDAVEAAAWLLDQLAVGELQWLSGKSEPPCWMSIVAQDSDELATTLRQMAIETISRQTQDLRAAVRVLHPKTFLEPVAPTPIRKPRVRTAKRRAA